MFCPQCGGKFRWHVMVCPTCDVDTVDALPEGDSGPRPKPEPDVELVQVLATGDAGMMAVARSMLEGEEIEYLVRGDNLQDLVGLGRITGFNYAFGPAEIWVRADDADRARDLLAGLTPGP